MFKAHYASMYEYVSKYASTGMYEYVCKYAGMYEYVSRYARTYIHRQYVVSSSSRPSSSGP